MIEPFQITIVERSGMWRAVIDVVQVAATIFLAIAAIRQAHVAKEQARTAKDQALAADIQATAAKASLKILLRPRFTPGAIANGILTLQNAGKGDAFAVRWKIERESNWCEVSEMVGSGDLMRMDVTSVANDRRIVVEYFSSEADIFTTFISLKDLDFEHMDPASSETIRRFREIQKRR